MKMTYSHGWLLSGFLAALSLLGAACDDSTNLPGMETDPGDTSSQESLDTENLATGLLGHYVERVTVSTLDTIPGLGERASTNRYYGLTDVEEVDGKIISTSVSCRSQLGGVSGVKVVISDELTQLIPPLVGEVSAQKVDSEVVYSRQAVYMPLGVELADPVNDELPTDPNDPRIFDQDLDGKPGVTIILSVLGMKGEIYAIRKEVGSWRVSGTGDGTFHGPFMDASSQKVIGASLPMLNVDMTSRHDPDQSKSTIDFIRTQEKYDCERLIAEIDVLFP
jgi:hypothetical protein